MNLRMILFKGTAGLIFCTTQNWNVTAILPGMPPKLEPRRVDTRRSTRPSNLSHLAIWIHRYQKWYTTHILFDYRCLMSWWAWIGLCQHVRHHNLHCFFHWDRCSLSLLSYSSNSVQFCNSEAKEPSVTQQCGKHQPITVPLKQFDTLH